VRVVRCLIPRNRVVCVRVGEASWSNLLRWRRELVRISIASSEGFTNHTRVENLQFVTCCFCAIHAIQQRSDASVFFAPEVVRNCLLSVICLHFFIPSYTYTIVVQKAALLSKQASCQSPAQSR
jgi:hypothetical protein